ncbi:acylamino-acid-releasing enzyme-like isoform X2 [Macrobrachium nipponense]|uniref:acylamino-acid-releasing enzyme-like isoform X2 n=1 Tax=Macrobrachium nipponense TaxID=159736 RepID=UPI0030C87B45
MLRVLSRVCYIKLTIPHLSQKRYFQAKMIDSVVEAYKSVAKISDLKKAQILSVSSNEEVGSHDVAVQVTWSSRNLSSLERTLTNSVYMVQGKNVISFPPSPAHKNAILSQHSPTGRRSAYVLTSEKDKEAECIMIVEKDGSMVSFDLKAAEKHGKVYADGEFACLEWSADETKLIYIAEKKKPKPTNFLVQPKSSNGEDTRGQEFQFVDDWGEQLEGKHKGVVCILDTVSGEVKSHELPNELCPGQLVWAPRDEGIIGVAFVSTPYRLGLIYCPNRESKLFHMDMEGNFSEISKGCSNIRTPRVSPDGTKIAFLRSVVGGPHAKCAQLCLVSWPSKEEKVVIDIVPRTMVIEEGYSFKGIYGYSGIPQRCWLSDSRRIAFSSYHQDNILPYIVNIDTGAITVLPHIGSYSVVDVCNDWLLVDASFLNRPNQLYLGHIPAEGQERQIKLNEVTERREIDGIPIHYRSHFDFVNDIPHPDPKYSDIPISVIYYGPVSLQEGKPKRPLICWPHGGPHSTATNVYNALPAFFVKLGYSIVFPNYRGSLGFGEDGVNALPGYCGTVDVSDVHKATLLCLERFKDVLDPNQVFLCGGSHGGYLVTQLAAQYPGTYSAIASRNPSCDYPSAIVNKDNPDLTFVETGFPFTHGKIPDAAILGKMFEMSPTRHIENLKTPVLFLIGKNDRRVPPAGGIFLHKMLLARGVETKLHIYDDCHPLSKVDVELDGMIHTALWFEKYRQK